MSNQHPVVMIYKRTHKGDPDADGVFGIHDCMGQVRNREYDAVVGIGGKRPDSGCEDIALKVNWIGVTPKKHRGTKRGPLVSFSRFCLYEDRGPLVSEIAPKLYKHMYQEPVSRSRRVVMSNSSLPSNVYDEVLEILKLAAKSSPSKGASALRSKFSKCGSNKRNCSSSKSTVSEGKARGKCR